MLSIPDLIAKKSRAEELSPEEVKDLVHKIVNGEAQDAQIGAMLMAILLRGMSVKETSELTRTMMNSGDVLEWPAEWQGSLVDKHSTGGVGDKVSLPLAPALAACGLKVPMISGRGLGFTGGTLDKLESLEGYQVTQTVQEMHALLDNVGCCIVGQTKTLVPADRILYSLRDVTATVKSIPLITGSIVSKKGAEGLNALVLDVKTGSGAMMAKESDARELASLMVGVGCSLGVKVTAVLSSMENPIGRMIGNALEVEESIRCLHGNGPTSLVELVTVLGGHLLFNAGKAKSAEAGADQINDTLKNGSALRKFCDMIQAQGVAKALAEKVCSGDDDAFDLLPTAKDKTKVKAKKSGYVHGINALSCANVSFALGAGRTKAGQPVDHAVGLQLHVDIGSHITEGDTWVTVHHNSELSEDHIHSLQEALVLKGEPLAQDKLSLILDVIEENNHPK